MLDGVVVVDARGRIERMNGAAVRILGLAGAAPDSLLGAPIEALRGANLFTRELQRTLAEGISVVVHDLVADPTTPSAEEQARNRTWSGDDRGGSVIDIETTPLLDGAGRVEGATLVLRDGTIGASLREAREARIQDQVFGRMAAGIAHEIKNPLGGIRGAAELLARQSDDKRSLRRAELIISEVDRIAALIDDFMGVANERLRLAPVNVHRVIDDVLAVAELDRLSTGVVFHRRFDPSIPELFADRDRLHQIFLNLARNALEAMREAPGTLTVSTGLRLDHRVDFEGGRRLPGVVIDIDDEGCGVAPELLDQVGTPFFTTKSGGTGLGLALCRHFVAQHGGSLHLKPRNPGGTRVRIVLPLRTQP